MLILDVVLLEGGSSKNNLKIEIAKLNLNKNVKLVGFKNKAEEYLSDSDIFVLSSKFEVYQMF